MCENTVLFSQDFSITWKYNNPFERFWIKSILIVWLLVGNFYEQVLGRSDSDICIWTRLSDEFLRFVPTDPTAVIGNGLLFICLLAYLNNRVISDIRKPGNCQNQVLERIFAYSNSDCRIRIPEYSGTISIALLSQFVTMLRCVLHKKYYIIIRFTMKWWPSTFWTLSSLPFIPKLKVWWMFWFHFSI